MKKIAESSGSTNSAAITSLQTAVNNLTNDQLMRSKIIRTDGTNINMIFTISGNKSYIRTFITGTNNGGISYIDVPAGKYYQHPFTSTTIQDLSSDSVGSGLHYELWA